MIDLRELRALTVLQPFAALIVSGDKTIELRTWPTKYRGLLAVCSGKRELAGSEDLTVAWRLGHVIEAKAGASLPLGRALSLVRLVDCRIATWGPGSTDSDAACISVERYREMMFKKQGSVRPVYAWVLERVCDLDLPVRGKQGLWRAGDALVSHASEKYLAYVLANAPRAGSYDVDPELSA